MSNAIMKDVQRAIEEYTAEMGKYAALMRKLSTWAQVQADKADYSDDFYRHFDND